MIEREGAESDKERKTGGEKKIHVVRERETERKEESNRE